MSRCTTSNSDIVANFPPVPTTPVATAASVSYVGGKFAAGIKDTGGKFSAGIKDTGGKFFHCYH